MIGCGSPCSGGKDISIDGTAPGICPEAPAIGQDHKQELVGAGPAFGSALAETTTNIPPAAAEAPARIFSDLAPGYSPAN